MFYKIISFLRRLNDKSLVYRILITPFKTAYQFYFTHLASDKMYLKHVFREQMGYKLNLNDPKTLNEKMQWLKLNDRTDLHTQCADKIAVRNYVTKIIGDKYLIPMILETSDINYLKPDNLPDYPFIIKANHDSGSYKIIRDKKDKDWNNIRNDAKGWLKRNYYKYSKEWQYKNIKPKILIEKLLLNNNNQIPNDYKLHCIHGKVEMISVDLDRGSDFHSRNWFDRNWKRTPFKWSSVYLDGKRTDPSDLSITKPICLEKMIDLSEKLAQPFKYVRIDWYELEEKLFFGEITFHHDSGLKPIEPFEWDLKLGSKINLHEGNS